MTESDAKLQSITTVQQLADYLNVEEKKLRGWLRKEFPKKAPGQGGVAVDAEDEPPDGRACRPNVTVRRHRLRPESDVRRR